MCSNTAYLYYIYFFIWVSVVMSSGGMLVKLGGQLLRAVSLLPAYGMALKLSGAVGTTFVC